MRFGRNGGIIIPNKTITPELSQHYRNKMNTFLKEYSMNAHPMLTRLKHSRMATPNTNPNITNIAWAMLIILIVALKNRYMTALLNVYLGCKLLYLYKAIQYGKNNPGVVFIENLAYNMKVNTFTAMRFIYKIVDSFISRQVMNDSLSLVVESSDSESVDSESVDTDSLVNESSANESSEEEDNDSSSDYEEWVYKRPFIQESHKDDEDDDDLSPLFTCKTCQITTKTKDYVFVVFCKDEYCFNCFTNVFYNKPMNEIVSYYLDETMNNRDDGWYNPETGTFYTGFWLESQFIPKMNDPENIKRYGESFIGGDGTLFTPKEDDDEDEEDNDSSEEEDNDSSSDYEERVFKKVDSAKDHRTFTCSVCEISTKNPYVEFMVFCGKEYCGTCFQKVLYTTPLNEVDAYLLSGYIGHDGWYDPKDPCFHIGSWINNEFVPLMSDVRNIHKYGDKDNESSEEENNHSSSDYEDNGYTNYISKDDVKTEETSSDDFADHDFTEHDFSEIL
jgi:hypothetical protein